MTLRQLSFLISLGALWGASFLFMRITSPVLGPFVVTAVRLYFASIFLFFVVKFFTDIKIRQLPWKKLLVTGLFNSALPFTLLAYGEVHLSASLGSILNGTTPIFTAFLASFVFHEKYSKVQIIGLAMGIIGVVVIVGWHPVPLNIENVTALGACLLAALSYAVGGLYAAQKVRGYPPLGLAFGQLTIAGLFLLPFMLYDLPSAMPSLNLIAALTTLGIVCTAFAFIIYYSLIRDMGASKTLTVTYILPIFGMLWGSLFLGEKIHLTYIIGLVTILSGVYLINRR